MFHRIYPTPFTRLNEAWNPLGVVYSNEQDPYCDPLITGKANGHWSGNPRSDFYNNIAIDIVTETAFNYPTPYFSEKSIRPLLYKRMFVLVAPVGQLEMLKHHGYKTFSPFINEEYDNIADPFDRMTHIIAEIERLCSMPLDKIKKAMLQYKDILEHNYIHVKTQKSRDLKNVAMLLGVNV
tara:strand:+ start:596 stop:1138 length:543 start_codon:yes stop_codon:yes gene_type:complete